jgi:hypothetical protein
VWHDACDVPVTVGHDACDVPVIWHDTRDVNFETD